MAKERQVSSWKEVPEARYYIFGVDLFMSGWGQAEGKTNIVVCFTDDIGEATECLFYMGTREDIENPRLVSTKPKDRPDAIYSLLPKESASRWYGDRRRNRKDPNG